MASDALRKLQVSSGKDVLVYLGPIDFGGWRQVFEFAREPICDEVLFIFSTFGGDAHAGYRIMRYLQKKYSKIHLIIPFMCKSAGTLMAIGAHEIIMTDVAEMGPLDVQVKKTDELNEYGSGLDIDQSFDFLSMRALDLFRRIMIDVKHGARIQTKMAGDFAAQISTGLFAPIYQQIDPARLGELARLLSIANDYGERLNYKTKILKPDALRQLVNGYPSHNFVIDREEAEEIFLRVREPSSAEQDAIDALWNIVARIDILDEPMVVLFSAEATEEENEDVDSADGDISRPDGAEPPPRQSTAGSSRPRRPVGTPSRHLRYPPEAASTQETPPAEK